MVLSTNSDVVKTAIVCPPTIYGPGRGPGNVRSRQVNTFSDFASPVSSCLMSYGILPLRHSHYVYLAMLTPRSSKGVFFGEYDAEEWTGATVR